MIKDYPMSTAGLFLSEHVPDLTAKEDILKVKAYLKKHYSQLDWELTTKIKVQK